jgi:hypothetical protein
VIGQRDCHIWHGIPDLHLRCVPLGVSSVWHGMDMSEFGPDGAIGLGDFGTEIGGFGFIDAGDGDAEGAWDGVGDLAWAAEAECWLLCCGCLGHVDAAVSESRA